MESSFGWLVNTKRNVMQLSVRELAKRVGVDAGYISKIEKGQTTNPSFSTVMKLAKELHLEMQSLIEVFSLDESMDEIIEDSFERSVPREEKELIQDIVGNIVNFTSNKVLDGTLLSEIFTKIFSLQEQKNQNVEMYLVITIRGNQWVNILQTPILNESFLNLYYEANGIGVSDMNFIVKGEIVSLPDFVSRAQIRTLEDLLNKCYEIQEDDDLYDIYMDMKPYLEKVLKNGK
ncbi:helix-turn-helix domain-containing protein [Heyndrickxia sp. NPDC080065]|uniref:helix-turn-helix domain-containing protein n=1 Tax=Heyndrickxia sp. NPDC080065 TaxID=3390568 RepID=UPI003CFED8E9